METKTAQEIGVQLLNIPDIFSVLINKDELELSNDKKLFQFALKEEIGDSSEDILVYLADFDDKNKTVKPLMASSFDGNGVFKKDLFEVFPPIYRKNKNDLSIVQ